MYSYYHEDKGFPMVRIESVAKDFIRTLESLINYNDGQGRNYDILDEELN